MPVEKGPHAVAEHRSPLPAGWRAHLTGGKFCSPSLLLKGQDSGFMARVLGVVTGIPRIKPVKAAVSPHWMSFP